MIYFLQCHRNSAPNNGEAFTRLDSRIANPRMKDQHLAFLIVCGEPGFSGCHSSAAPTRAGRWPSLPSYKFACSAGNRPVPGYVFPI